MCQYCKRKLPVQCWPISHEQLCTGNYLQCYLNLCGPTLRKGISSIILVHSWQKTLHTEAVAQACSIKKLVLRNFAKFTEKYLCQSLFFNKVTGLRLATLFKKRLWHRCSSLNVLNFFKNTFFTEHLRTIASA